MVISMRKSLVPQNRRAQQALEYLITYGWAFVVILLTIGAFAYFGLLSPVRYLPERCDFGTQMLCADFVLESSDPDPGHVRVRVQNAYGHSIAIHDFQTADMTGTFEAASPVVKILDGDVSEPLSLDLGGTEEFLVKGEKMTISVMINFTRCDDSAGSCTVPVDAPYHVVQGEIFAKVQ